MRTLSQELESAFDGIDMHTYLHIHIYKRYIIYTALRFIPVRKIYRYKCLKSRIAWLLLILEDVPCSKPILTKHDLVPDARKIPRRTKGIMLPSGIRHTP